MEGLDVLKKQRAILRSSVTRTCNNIIAILKDETVNNDEVAGLYELLLERFQELKVSDEKISLEQSSLDEDALVKEQERVDEYTALYFQTKGMVDKLTVKVQSDVSEYNSCQRQMQGQALYKLPPLKLKEFGGELNQWLPFWAQFQKIHEDPNMPAVDKLGYLSMCIVKDSPAQRVINSYPATEAMYPEIVKALKDRFGRPDLLTELYIREMMSLVLQNTISKDKMSIPDLYDRLQSHLRNLDSLGVTTENYASILLPLVSSSLSSELLQIWERTCSATVNRDSDATSKEKLNSLLSFLRCEVEQSQKLKLAQSNFGLTADTDQHIKARREAPVRHTRDSKQERFATATGLTNNTFQEVICIFCQNKHKSYECLKAKDMPQEKKQELIKESRTCFICLRSGHRAFQCKANIKCKKCSARHYDVMCSARSTSSCIASNRVDSVLLQTLVVKLLDPFGGRSKDVRVLIDTGSQRSYIVKNLAQEMGYKPFETVSVRHALFGGGVTKAVDHNVFRLKVSSVLSDYTCNFEAMDQDQICLSVPISIAGPWMQELSAHNIQLCDSSTSQEVDILIGSDIAAKLWTGRVHKLECGLVAMETHLGWTLSGKMPSVSTASQEDRNTVAAIVTSLYVREACVSDLWSLDVLGIQNPSEKMLQEDIDQATEEYFLSTVRVNSQERFEVRLPFLSEHPPLSENLTIAKMRLASTQKKLEKDGYTEAYQEVLTGWEKDGIIEKVSTQSVDKPAFYMPHRHVIKPGSTTPVRPVFDASAKEVGKHSLNDCLEKGPNLIKNIPSCLARFRTDKVAVSGDIAKAFLQISVHEDDRDFLRFLWTENGELITYRHCRVVFGVNVSPFLLEACINLHLENTNFSHPFVEKLKESFYVDNCLASFENEILAREFMNIASTVMMERKFDLRGWEMTGEIAQKPTNILGLLWNKERDTLAVSNESLLDMNFEKITKKVILGAAHRVFDPIGIVTSFVLVPKLLLQQTWAEGLSWNEEVGDDIKTKFLQWTSEIPLLAKIEVPRWAMVKPISAHNLSLHIFSDASKHAYASVVFLRVETESEVTLRLLAARSRVAPTSKSKGGMTIPRLELLAASIGTRLYQMVKDDYKLQEVRASFWTDATTVLAWIKKQEPWNTFVMNRVKEIRLLSEHCEWRHVPGVMNPADIPSRGSTLKNLIQSTWWEGPEWLKGTPESWPQQEGDTDQSEVYKERKKTVVSAAVQVADTHSDWYYKKFSNFKSIVRMIGWILRFKSNTLKQTKHTGELSAEEYDLAERKVLFLVQQESFSNKSDTRLDSLMPFVDELGLIRLKTKVFNIPDAKDFSQPIVLPNTDHPVVRRLVEDVHVSSSHAGTQILMSILRQQYWILGGRKTIRSVVKSCVKCKRYTAKKLEVHPTPLPQNRVRDAKLFEILGVDLAGPLFIRGDGGCVKKVWIVLFTCAVYRAIRLEVVSSLSTDSFVQAFRRFCSKNGRPKICYSDQGTNLVGFESACQKLDWDKITQYSTAKKIEWKLNPPSAPWWGGWWERMVGILKTLLRRVLGRSSVNYEELLTLISECEAIVNARPLTYIPDGEHELAAITPAMFLHDLDEVGFPEYDFIGPKDFGERLKYRNDLKKQLRERFRSEYLGQLKLFSSKKREHDLKEGDIVLIGDDNVKRLDWPMGRVVELVKGHDKCVRMVRVKTASGILSRPVQRLYLLETVEQPDGEPMENTESTIVPDIDIQCEEVSVSSDHVDYDSQKVQNLEIVAPERLTRRGRSIRKPSRFIQ
ncbi:hypothetical protein M8J77_012174 [Diaphorina citri]|nr:hypothetical protein M8J77_012174 [Diaphorina citri]